MKSIVKSGLSKSLLLLLCLALALYVAPMEAMAHAPQQIDLAQGSLYIHLEGYSRNALDTRADNNPMGTYQPYTNLVYEITQTTASALDREIVITPGCTQEFTLILNGINVVTNSASVITTHTHRTTTVVLKSGSKNRLESKIGCATIHKVAGSGKLTLTCENAGAGHSCGASCGEADITGGMQNTGAMGAAAVGGNANEDAGNIEISGGNWIIKSGSRAAGIGGGQKASGHDIAVSGGSLDIDSEGAAIGGGQSGDGYNITLSGGVTRLGNSSQTSVGGGSGYFGAGGGYSASPNGGAGYNITFSGGSHDILGKIGGASGVSGGAAGATGDIRILGGSIQADRYNPDSSPLGAKNAAGQPVYRFTMTTEQNAKLASMTVRNANGSAYDYGINDMQTLETGNVCYPFLPEGARVYAVTLTDGSLYIPKGYDGYTDPPYFSAGPANVYNAGFAKLANGFVPATGIAGVETSAAAGQTVDLRRTFDVMKIQPANATYSHIYRIKWSIKDAGTTGAAFTDNERIAVKFNSGGTAIVTATIEGAGANFGDFKQDYAIKVTGGALAKVTGLKTSALKTSGLTLSWSKTAGATRYEVYNGSKRLATTTGTKYTLTRQKPGALYNFKVRAAAADGRYGGYSAAVKAATLPNTAKISKLATKSKGVTLTLKKQGEASGYEVYMSGKKASGYRKLTALTKNSKVRYSKSKLTKGKTYYFRVRAYKIVGAKKVYGAYSPVARIKVK